MSFNQITPTFCNAMSKFTAALDCALCEVSATFACIERTYWIMITCSTKLQNCMLNGSKRDILYFGVDFWPERIINPSTGETGLRWHWCPYCAPLWGDQCQAARKYSGKFHYQFVVLLNLSSFFIMLFHKEIATNLSFLPADNDRENAQRRLWGVVFQAEGGRSNTRGANYCSVCTCFFQFFSSYFCILINKWPVNNILFLCAHLQDIPKKC